MVAKARALRNAGLVIFDWDGTLYRSIDLIQTSIVAAGHEVGAEISNEIARSIIGLGLKAAQKLLFPEKSGNEKAFFTAFHMAYRRHYEAGEAAIQLYEGAYDLIAALHAQGRRVAVATAKSRAGIDRSLETMGLAAFVRHTRTPEECLPKPNPQMILEILAESGFTVEQAVMVGDTTHDLQMAINAGVAGVGISHGAHNHADLAALEVAAVCRSISELKALII